MFAGLSTVVRPKIPAIAGLLACALAGLPSASAFAACPEPSVATLTCGESISEQLDPGPWGGATPPASCDAAFDDLDSSIGGSGCMGDMFGGFCFGWTCSGPMYTCGEPAFGEGPEHVYDVVCPSSGSIDLTLSADCDLDLYVLPEDTCAPGSCVFGSTNTALQQEGGTVACTEGEPLRIVVEGFGFTRGGRASYGGGAGYCQTHTATPTGNYTLSVDCDAIEECDVAGDEDGDGDEDCADSDCFDEPFCCDDDGDGFDDILCGGGDCDDSVFDAPGADSDGDGILDDCDVCPAVSDPTQADADGDSVGDACDVCPGADDLGDADGDGSVCADDCDDADAGNFPGNTEQCDGADNDCNGMVDEDVVFTDHYLDADGDGFGDPNTTPMSTCDGPPTGYAPNDGDCDDTSSDASSTYPGAPEQPDGQDDDCDGVVDDGTDRFDDDFDGVTELGGDCDDSDPSIVPGAVDSCVGASLGVDDDCDGVPDDGTTCGDDDGDGFCEGPVCSGAAVPGDCNDGDAAVNPDAPEVQGNGLDDDCDGQVDGKDPDPDGDGVSEAGGDCAPNNPDVGPGAIEVPNGVDDDCDGETDEDTPVSDDDGDGASESVGDCDDSDPTIGPTATEQENGRDDDCDGQIDEGTAAGDDDFDGFTENGGDCDDANPDITPGAPEQDNGIDDDCDGQIDEGLADRDGDGFTEGDGDCDDDDGFVNPGIDEICDQIDNDCDGQTDEGCDEDPTPVEPDTGGCQSARGPMGPSWLVFCTMGLLLARRRRT